MLSDKKGVLLDHFFVIKTMFIFAILLVFASVVWYSFSNSFAGLDSSIADSSVKADIAVLDNIYPLVDKFVPMIFVVLWGLVLFFGSKTTPTSPLGLFISLGALLLISFVSIILTDVARLILAESVFTPIINEVSNSFFFLNNLHYISFFFGLIALGFFYSKGVFGGSDTGGLSDEGIE